MMPERGLNASLLPVTEDDFAFLVQSFTNAVLTTLIFSLFAGVREPRRQLLLVTLAFAGFAWLSYRRRVND